MTLVTLWVPVGCWVYTFAKTFYLYFLDDFSFFPLPLQFSTSLWQLRLSSLSLKASLDIIMGNESPFSIDGCLNISSREQSPFPFWQGVVWSTSFSCWLFSVSLKGSFVHFFSWHFCSIIFIIFFILYYYIWRDTVLY